jgi:hypothetical protein
LPFAIIEPKSIFVGAADKCINVTIVVDVANRHGSAPFACHAFFIRCEVAKSVVSSDPIRKSSVACKNVEVSVVVEVSTDDVVRMIPEFPRQTPLSQLQLAFPIIQENQNRIVVTNDDVQVAVGINVTQSEAIGERQLTDESELRKLTLAIIASDSTAAMRA